MSPSSSLQEWRTRRRRQGMVSSDPMNKTKELRNFESAKRNKKNRRIRDISRRIKKIRNEEVRFGILPVECQFQPRRCLRYTRYTVYTSTPLHLFDPLRQHFGYDSYDSCDDVTDWYIVYIHYIHIQVHMDALDILDACSKDSSKAIHSLNEMEPGMSCLCTFPDTLQSPYITVAQTRSLRLKVPAFRNGTFENSHLRVNHCQLVNTRIIQESNMRNLIKPWNKWIM